jgi:hypothetical protein
MIALSACPPHRRPSIGPTRKRAYARREASSAKTAVNEALTLYLIRATHQTLSALIHNLHFCNSVLYFKGFSPPANPTCVPWGRRPAGTEPCGPRTDFIFGAATPNMLYVGIRLPGPGTRRQRIGSSSGGPGPETGGPGTLVSRSPGVAARLGVAPPCSAGTVEAGAVEAGAVEAGAVEAGAVEAGAVEAGAVEAGIVEAGTAAA